MSVHAYCSSEGGNKMTLGMKIISCYFRIRKLTGNKFICQSYMGVNIYSYSVIIVSCEFSTLSQDHVCEQSK